MNKECKVATALVVTLVFYFASVSMVEAKGPIWQIYRARSNKSIPWKTHAANPRFAKWKAGTNGDPSDDLVLDRETGLVWARDANLTGTEEWAPAMNYCRDLMLGNRKGWRLPTVEELSSLLGPEVAGANLPAGHPFVNEQISNYWCSTSYETNTANARMVHMGNGTVSYSSKGNSLRVWPVRGGNGYATGNW